MSGSKPSARTGLVARLLSPIQKIIQAILPGFVEADLKSPDIRDAMVLAADEALVLQNPLAGFLPTEIRRRLIRKQLDLIIDEILLNDALPAGEFQPVPPAGGTAPSASPSVGGPWEAKKEK